MHNGGNAVFITVLCVMSLFACTPEEQQQADEALEAAGAAAEAAGKAPDRARMIATEETIKVLARGIEQYIMDFPGVGVPRVENTEQLVVLLDRLEILLAQSGLDQDGWGYPISFRREDDGSTRNYVLRSPGPDGQSGSSDDYVYSSGRFIQRPAQ